MMREHRRGRGITHNTKHTTHSTLDTRIITRDGGQAARLEKASLTHRAHFHSLTRALRSVCHNSEFRKHCMRFAMTGNH
jgi:hypothetical protein